MKKIIDEFGNDWGEELDFAMHDLDFSVSDINWNPLAGSRLNHEGSTVETPVELRANSEEILDEARTKRGRMIKNGNE